MAIPRADATAGQRLKALEDKVRRPALQPTVTLAASAPAAVAKNSLLFDSSNGNAPSYWDGQAWVPVRDETIAVAQATADAALAEAGSDGTPPSASPDPVSLAGVGYFILKWTPIVNADPVTYEVHVSATSGFTPGSGTLVGQTSSSQFIVKALPGPEPGDGEPDTRVLDYDTTYYAVIVAKDADGVAAQSAETVCTLTRVTGPDLAANSVTADNIVTATITGDKFSANVIVAGVFKTAETGQRVEWGTDGIQAYKPDNSQMINVPTDGSEGLIDIEVIARGLTATDGASLSGTSELNADATLTLQQGITPPSFMPQVGVTYDTIQIVTTGLSAAQKTGALGTFDLVPSEIYCMEWKDAATDYWVLHQIRSNGTRAWFFRVSDGAPLPNGGGGAYFTDYTNWEYYSVVEITSGAHAGVYRMGRWIPHGAANDFYLTSPQGINRYSRQNGNVAPTLGTDGTDIFVAEVVNTDDLRVRYFVPTGTGENLASPTSTTESTTGFTMLNGLCTILYGNFDMGSGRYVVAHRATNFDVQMLTVSAGAFYPGGSGNNWASANKAADTWECPTTNRRAMAWDAANSVFWTFGGDGFMYKHTSERWDPAVNSSTYWAETTYYDSAGTTHETTPGPAKSYLAKRRAKNFFTPPALTLGGADDPDNYRLYMARGATAPANSAYHLQYTGATNTAWQTMATATANPPTSNNFPGATPAEIKNPAGTLSIKADGSIAAASMTKGGIAVAVEGPYYYAWVSSQAGVAQNTTTTLAGYTSLGSSGITVSSGVFTLPRAGRYRIYGQQYWAAQASPVGSRIAQWQHNSTNVASATVAAQNSALTGSYSVATGTTIVAAANDTVRFKFTHDAGGTSAPITSARDLTFIVIEYIGA
jgi:hypothetical protein